MDGLKAKNTVNIIRNHENIRRIDGEIKKYWMRHPFTPGHGYAHSLNVAKNAYNLAEKNNYGNPLMAFIAGLLHDITRPIENKGGEEKHAELNGKIAEKILLKTTLEKSQIQEIKQAIVNHERLSKKNRISLLSIILYLADKTDMNLERCLVYGFVSNFNCLKEKKKQPYNNLGRAIKDFNKKLSSDKKTLLYIKKTFPKIKGSTMAINKYNATFKKFNLLLKRKKNNYPEYIRTANQLTKNDVLKNKKCLKITGVFPKQIDRIVHSFTEILI